MDSTLDAAAWLTSRLSCHCSPTPECIEGSIRSIQEAQSRLDEADRRFAPAGAPVDWGAWAGRARAFGAYRRALAQALTCRHARGVDLSVWTREAIGAPEPGGLAEFIECFEADIERLRAGEPGPIEATVRYLEADPCDHGSGYRKARIMRYLARHDLRPWQERLTTVVLAIIDADRPRKEFRAMIRLARRIDSAELRSALAIRVDTRPAPSARHATWLLASLHAHDGPDVR